MITNDPVSKRKVTPSHVLWNNLFTEDELLKLENTCAKEQLEKAVTVGAGEDCDDLRRSRVKFINRNDENYWIFNKFNNLIDRVNNIYFEFDLYGYESFHYTTYDSSNSGMYDWHMDAILDNNTTTDSMRKLTLVMLLTEPQVHFSGGEFQLNVGMEKNAITPELNRGSIVVFPSFMIHRVKPVLLGTRRSIVIWVEGPKFR
jgi:PKHD-type hydroxylase